MKPLPYKISTLVYLRNAEDEILLMQRKKAPNKGFWSPIGGKLEMDFGESPHETAIREVREETGLGIGNEDLHLFSMIAEKNYEDRCHWLMFLFDCKKVLPGLPPAIDEGTFAFFKESEIANLKVPESDRLALWPVYFQKRQHFTAFRANCQSGKQMEIAVEEFMPLHQN